jgi:hypothetical protein
MTMSIMTFTDPGAISDLLDYIHDCPFKVDDISFDREGSVLSIRFGRELADRARVISGNWFMAKRELPLGGCFLRILHVQSYSLNDMAHIGTYLMTDLEFDQNLGRVSVISAQPLDIHVNVEHFEITVEETDRIVGVMTAWTVLFIETSVKHNLYDRL